MKKIKLCKYGEVLGSRELGKRVRKETNIDNENIILDFTDVRIVCNSFADELIGRLIEKEGLNKFCNHVKVENASERIKIILKMVMMNRI